MPLEQLLEHLPPLVCALCLSAYWASVILLGFRLRRKIGKGPNSIPPDPVGLAMRVAWVPAIVLQMMHAWRITIGMHWPYPPGHEPAYVTTKAAIEALSWPVWLPLAGVASLIVIVCLSLTFVCWRKMGKSWRIGIDRGEKLELVSSGPYRFVRHPIYALRILLDACAIIAIPTAFMAVVSGVDMLMLAIEARREERYMEATHGATYVDYQRRVGRFVPRLFVPKAPSV